MPDPRPQPHQDQDLHSRNADLLQRFHSSADHRLRNRLVELNLPLVRQVAGRVSASTRLPLEDLVQLGCLGLIRAIEAFDPSRPTALSSFAVPYVHGSFSMQRVYPCPCWPSLTAVSPVLNRLLAVSA
ncbi:sigma factor [Synechococcus sp. CS-205]|uniref:sigma factor n=1 Tax=Synechococcus sp. CS-205 TaxID=2847984 RepID=UPI00223BEEDD|nr:sigma factor [Synechococcus sp. CS-205]MCT0247465.1 hypothetical protein [Synechococcus sp. CS-205]